MPALQCPARWMEQSTRQSRHGNLEAEFALELHLCISHFEIGYCLYQYKDRFDAEFRR